MNSTITKVDFFRYGAPMGRIEHGGNVDEKLYLRRVPLDSGGYDSGGAYWGIGAPLFECFNETGDFTRYLRAGDRERAKELIRADYPDARFHR